MIANCGGTLKLWEETHGQALPDAVVVAHNAVSASRRRGYRPPEAVIRCVGSLRAYKGVAALVQAASQLPLLLELVGGSPDEQAALGPVPANVHLRPPVPYPAVPDLLASSAALVLPLADNLFGRQLTSPLKLWDYLATSAPIIAPDLPTVREIAELSQTTIHTFDPAHSASLIDAVRAALQAPLRSPSVRTWHQRAQQTLPVLLGPESR
ncbi:MAG: glycosyltransferase family 4 protein [Oligoflexia bacterium]|nr:glycosyltransferase family 4 protein [Oligoflexia bacterium]